MESAEDVVEKIIRDKNAPWVKTTDLKALNSFDWSGLIELLTKALESYANSRLDEAAKEAGKSEAMFFDREDAKHMELISNVRRTLREKIVHRIISLKSKEPS